MPPVVPQDRTLTCGSGQTTTMVRGPLSRCACVSHVPRAGEQRLVVTKDFTLDDRWRDYEDVFPLRSVFVQVEAANVWLQLLWSDEASGACLQWLGRNVTVPARAETVVEKALG